MRVFLLDPFHFTSPYTENLAHSLFLSGCKVRTFIGLSNKSFVFSYFNLHKSRKVRQITKIFCYPFYLFYIIANIFIFKPNKVIINIMPLPIIDYLFVKIIKKITSVTLILHNTNNFHGEVSGLRSFGYLRYVKEFNGYLSHSSQGVEFLKGLGIEASLIHKIDFPLKLKEMPSNNLEIRRSSNLLLFYGIIRPYKGIALLHEAMQLLKTDDKLCFQLIIAGRWNEKLLALKEGFCDCFAENELDIKDEFIVDNVENKLLSNTRAIVLPYDDVDGSGVLANSLEYNVPVICSDLDPFKEILGSDYPLLFRKGDCAHLAEMIDLAMSKDEILNSASIRISEVRRMMGKWDDPNTGRNYLR